MNEAGSPMFAGGSRPDREKQSATRWLVETLVIAAAYAVTAKIGQIMAIPPGNVTILWPAAGIAFAAVLNFGPRSLPGIWLGAAFINAYTLADGLGGPTPKLALVSAAIGVGNLLEAFVGAYLVRRYGNSESPIETGRAALRFIGIAILACLIGSSIGTGSLIAAKVVSTGAAATTWLTWWMGDIFGVVVFTPLPLSMGQLSRLKAAVIVVAMAGGFYWTYFASETLRTESQATWDRHASSTTERFTSAILSRLDLAYAPIYSFVALFRGSGDVSEEEFLNAVYGYEEIQGGIFPTAMAYATPHASADGSWRISYSTDIVATVARNSIPPLDSPVAKAIAAALSQPGYAQLAAMARDDSGRDLAIVSITADSQSQTGVILSLVDYGRLIDGLFATDIPSGIGLRLALRPAGDRGELQEVYNSSGALRPVRSIVARAVSANAQLKFSWDVSGAFDGGPKTELADAALVGGIVGTVLIVVLINFLIMQNEAIAARVRARTAEVAAKTEFLTAVLESMSEGLVAFDSKLRLIAANKQFKKLRGYPDDLVTEGRPFQDFMRHDVAHQEFGPGDPEQIFIDKVSAAGNFTKHEFVRQRPDGRIIEVRGGPLPDGGFVSTYRDITEQKAAEARLAERERWFRSLLESAPDATVIADAKGEIIQINRQAEILFEYAREELLGQPVEILVPAEMRRRHTDLRHRFVTSSAPRTMGVGRDLIGRKKGGGEFPVEISLSPIDAEGEVQIAASVRDVTERRKVEEKLARQVEELNDARRATLNMMADAETARKHADELRAQAESATQAKAAFLATMSHEIRTPMNGVIGMVDLLAQTRLEDDQRQMMRTIRASAYALLTIINDILDFSKIEAGKLELEKIPTSISDAVEGVAETLAPNARKKGVRLGIYVDPAIPDAVLADQVRIRQVLFNLGGNAVKFTEKGRVLIRADRIPASDDSKSVKIAFNVIDNGIGISKDGQAQLFKAFTQAESSTTRRFGGTGLGLSICQRLTEMMGGEIGVESEPGKGSTFYVNLTLPIAESHDIKSDGHDLSGLRVLLQVDDPDRGVSCAKYLTAWKAETSTCPGVDDVKAAAVAATEAGVPPHVIVFDHGPPLESLAVVIDDIRAIPALAKVRFVVMTETRSRKERPDIVNTVYVETGPMRRSAFIRAVAVAAGRASPDVEYGDEEIVAAAVKAPTVDEAAKQGRLILIAEDNVTNQDVIRRQLGVLGYAAEIADDGKQALDKWKSNRYAILLTDCHMPEMDGFQLTREIRQAEQSTRSRIPIVAITASALQAEIDRCYESGMDDFLPKPLEMAKLKTMLKKWMPAKGSDAANAETQPAADTASNGPKTGETARKPTDGANPIDPSSLIGMFGDDPVTIKEILKDFVAPALANVKEIQDAYAAKSVDGVAKAAHKLKSSSRAVGANELADLCLHLETSGKAGNWDAIEKSAPGLKAVADKVVAHIETL